MRVPGKIDREEGLLSLDFMIGFAIFMIALIFVAIMISGLLVHLQSRTIDYDAVAYRTSVVLLEDPGEPSNWHLNNLTYPAERDDVRRLGLTVEKNYPGILKMTKVDKFFTNSTPLGCYGLDAFCTPDDYRSRLIFGDYPYRFNISMKGLGATSFEKRVGDLIPVNSSYGFVKRIVKVQMENATLRIPLTPESDLNQTTIVIRIDFSDLYARVPPYRIDPLNEEMRIFITGFDSLSQTNITDVKICTYPLIGTPGCIGEDAYDDHPRMNVTINGSYPYTPGMIISDNLTMIIDEGFFYRVGYDRFDAVDAVLTFDQNVTNQSLYHYDYTTIDNLPWLEPAVVEVRVW